jgi:hypothetical protein
LKTHGVSLSLLALCLIVTAVPVSAQQLTMYDNGPVNGQVNAQLINFGDAVTDSFYNGNGDVYMSSFTFWAWLFPGDTLDNVEVSIGTTPLGGDLYQGYVTPIQDDCFVNGFGFNVCAETVEFFLYPYGTAWLTLQNASVPSGDPVYWDQNGGVGCMSQGCPSLARQAGVVPTATIPSETFIVYGDMIAASPH